MKTAPLPPPIEWEPAPSPQGRRQWVDLARDLFSLPDALKDLIAQRLRVGRFSRSVTLRDFDGSHPEGLDGLFILRHGPLALMRRSSAHGTCHFRAVHARHVLGTWCVDALLPPDPANWPAAPSDQTRVQAPEGASVLFLARHDLAALLADLADREPTLHRALVERLRTIVQIDRMLADIMQALGQTAVFRQLNINQVVDLLEGARFRRLATGETLELAPRRVCGDDSPCLFILSRGQALMEMALDVPYAVTLDAARGSVLDLEEMQAGGVLRAVQPCLLLEIDRRRVKQIIGRSAALRWRILRSTSPATPLNQIARMADKQAQVLAFTAADPDPRLDTGAPALRVSTLVTALAESLQRQFGDRCLILRVFARRPREAPPQDELWQIWPRDNGDLLREFDAVVAAHAQKVGWPDTILIDLTRAPQAVRHALRARARRWFQVPTRPGPRVPRVSCIPLAEMKYLATEHAPLVELAHDVAVQLVSSAPPPVPPDPGWGPLLAHAMAEVRLLSRPEDGDLPVTRDSVDRMARVATQRAVGVALGGGGATGFVHMAALQALQAAKVPIDYVSGASFGSVVGAFYCAQGDEGLQHLLNDAGTLVAVALRTMVQSRHIERWVDRHLGGVLLRDLPLPFYPVGADAEDFSAAVPQLCSTGRAVRASGALPPFFAPVLWKGDKEQRVVDGFFVANVPAEILVGCDVGMIVAVNTLAAPADGHHQGATQGTSATQLGFEVAAAALGRLVAPRWRDAMRGALEVVHDISAASAARADVRIDLPVSALDAFLFHRGPTIARRAQEHLAAHPEAVEAASLLWRTLSERHALLRRGDDPTV